MTYFLPPYDLFWYYPFWCDWPAAAAVVRCTPINIVRGVHQHYYRYVIVVAIFNVRMLASRAVLPDPDGAGSAIPTLMVKVLPPFAAAGVFAAPMAAIGVVTINAQLLQKFRDDH